MPLLRRWFSLLSGSLSGVQGFGIIQRAVVNGSAVSGGSISATFANPTRAGTTILCSCMCSSGNVSPSATLVSVFSDNNSNTWVVDVAQRGANSLASAAAIGHCAINASAKSSHTITCNFAISASAGDMAMEIIELFPFNVSSPTTTSQQTGSPFSKLLTRSIDLVAVENSGSGTNTISITSGSYSESTPTAGLGGVTRLLPAFNSGGVSFSCSNVDFVCVAASYG